MSRFGGHNIPGLTDGGEEELGEEIVDSSESQEQTQQTQQTPQAATTVEVAKAQLLAELSLDPEISAILRARQSGKKISIVDASSTQDQQTKEAPKPSKSLAEMSNEELAEFQDQKTAFLMETVLDKVLEKKLAPAMDQFQAMQSVVQQAEQAKVDQEIGRLQGKYKDFNTMVPTIQKLNGETKGLKLEELYLLAKARSGQAPIPQTRVQSERPNNPSPVPARVKSRPVGNTPNDFRSVLQKSLTKLDTSSQIDD